MTTQITQPATPLEVPAVPQWRAGQEAAFNAAWLATGQVSIPPYVVSMTRGPLGVFASDIHYAENRVGVYEFAGIYDVGLTITPYVGRPGWSTYRARAIVAGVQVTAWSNDRTPETAAAEQDQAVQA